MKRLHAIWELGDLPFHVGVRDSSKNTGVPDTFPFTLGVDRELGSLVQMPHPDLGGLLDQAYVEGSQIGTPMSDSPSGRPVADDFIAFICETLGTEDLDGIRILEVGCGKGYLMSRLAEMGATVLGFEPGHSSPIYAEKAGLTVLKEPFRRSAVDEQYDVILHYGVLEHVEDPRPFLLEQAEVLSPGGRIVFAVPDCAPAIECGDLSIIVHEHWSYFTEESLRSLATHYGFRVEQIQRGKAAGALYTSMTPAENTAPTTDSDPVEFAEAYADRARAGVNTMREYVANATLDGGKLGVFCAARFINYPGLLELDWDRIRFFDDDAALENKFYPPLPAPVLSRDTLLQDPVDHLLIMSRTFGPTLAGQLRARPELSGCTILTIADLF